MRFPSIRSSLKVAMGHCKVPCSLKVVVERLVRFLAMVEIQCKWLWGSLETKNTLKVVVGRT